MLHSPMASASMGRVERPTTVASQCQVPLVIPESVSLGNGVLWGRGEKAGWWQVRAVFR